MFSFEKLLTFISTSVAEFPQKVCVYSTLIGLLNVRNYSFGGEVVEKLLLDFKKYLNQGQYEKARVLVRFFSDLVNTRVISSASLINLFENLIDVTIEDNIPQVRSDFFVYTVLSALPWSGKELFDKKEAELDQMLNTIDSYISKVRYCLFFYLIIELIVFLIVSVTNLIIILLFASGTLMSLIHRRSTWTVCGRRSSSFVLTSGLSITFIVPTFTLMPFSARHCSTTSHQ